MTRPVKGAVLAAAIILALYVVSSVSIDRLRRAQVSGNEVSAIGTVRAILSAQAAYATTECGGLYAPRLTILGAANVISPDLGSADVAEKSDYRIVMTPAPGAAPQPPVFRANCASGVAGFLVKAEPIAPGETGARFFRATEKGDLVAATNAEYSDATPLR